MAKYNVLVTGIGGNVGQGIIRNLQSLKLDMRIVGCNVTEVSPGSHLCDVVYKVPFAYEEAYISELLAICKQENIQLVLPSTDYEVYYLSLHQARFEAAIPVSNPETNLCFLDKYKTWEFFNAHQIPFAASYLPSNYAGQFSEYIVKPREGRGSRGLHLNPTNWKSFSDEYMIQRLHKGKEITTAFYITRSGELHGLITFERELQSGATVFCEVCTQYDSKMLEIIQKMMKHLPISASCNVQAIVDKDTQQIIPFEINGRISGTNSIRSQFGFKDIQYLVEEFLLDQNPEPIKVTGGSAIRVLMDVIYPNTSLKDVKNKHTTHYLY
ncbi:MAG: ATP-grasp domain-containing protein [Cytophagales bacterium]|nr:MAG: ATP-grasp domain-containing protein [Cytophagales bacterium]TAF61896.1 MAG: ATP-grasp domain-containing protein [Cytophagales bacterium]